MGSFAAEHYLTSDRISIRDEFNRLFHVSIGDCIYWRVELRCRGAVGMAASLYLHHWYTRRANRFAKLEADRAKFQGQWFASVIGIRHDNASLKLALICRASCQVCIATACL